MHGNTKLKSEQHWCCWICCVS